MEKFIELFKNELEDISTEITPETNYVNSEFWDSLTAVTVQMMIQDNYEILTERTKGMLPYMIGRNWLVSYATIAGLEMILFQMDYKTKHRAHMQEAIVEIQDFYTEFESEFFQFFEELVLSCQQKLKELNEIL